jgi:hypothetical protein
MCCKRLTWDRRQEGQAGVRDHTQLEELRTHHQAGQEEEDHQGHRIRLEYDWEEVHHIHHRTIVLCDEPVNQAVRLNWNAHHHHRKTCLQR